MWHLAMRAMQRGISVENMRQLDHWLLKNPEVPDGRWFKRFGDFTICGTGELVTTFLTNDQSASGEEVE